MKLIMRKMAVAAVLAAASVAAQAVPLAATTMHADTGTFDVGGYTSAPNPWSFAGADIELIGAINTEFGSSFTWFNCCGSILSGDATGTYAPYGSVGVPGGNPISAVVDAETATITVDLSSWIFYWNGSYVNLGTPSATGTWDPASGAYNIGWSATWVGGPFDGQMANWSLQGVALVPEASTYALMLAGLGLVGGAVRRARPDRII